METKQLAHSLEVPMTADSVESPILNYSDKMTCIHFLTDDNRWGGVTFESLDSNETPRGKPTRYLHII